MISKYYGNTYSLRYLRELSHQSREGVSLLSISEVAEKIGFRSQAVRTTFDGLRTATLPCIAHWRQNHFIVVYRIKGDRVYVADPSTGRVCYSASNFLLGWVGAGEDKGILLLLEPASEFYKTGVEDEEPTGFGFLFSYLLQYRKFLVQLFFGLLATSVLLLIFPFLTASVVDIGIKDQDIGFIYVILLAQLVLFVSRRSVEFIRGWILLHVGSRVNISIISDFLAKLLKQPLPFFEVRVVGDILQRINDHRRVEYLLTAGTLNTLFSLVNLTVFGVVLAIYSIEILLIFLVGTLCVVIWVVLFLGKLREYDHKRFSQLSENQNRLVQLINGVQELKLCASDKQKRWEWEYLQARLFKLNVRRLVTSQYQQAGMLFLKNILATIYAARAVIEGDMSLGMMMAVSYMIGQMNVPIEQMAGLLQSAQDAKLSLGRIAEIHGLQDEEDPSIDYVPLQWKDEDIRISNLCFQYEGQHSDMVLKDVTLCIPHAKTTAIVGVSGSGKTTLIKLLLKFYKPTRGEIRLGSHNFTNISNTAWRKRCGVVMQDGFIFSDTIAKNIALGVDQIDQEAVLEAARIANIQEFIESLPLGYTTKIGPEGHGLSQGQRQRILIARAIYKNPRYIFFDEATNALDANNEELILRSLDSFFRGRTVVIVAHRLSTVRKADQIIVLDDGSMIETGTHDELSQMRGAYYQLVKNQLELGT